MIEYQVVNYYDDQNRMMKLPAYYETSELCPVGQVESHGISYLAARRLYQQMGDVMGLDKILSE